MVRYWSPIQGRLFSPRRKTTKLQCSRLGDRLSILCNRISSYDVYIGMFFQCPTLIFCTRIIIYTMLRVLQSHLIASTSGLTTSDTTHWYGLPCTIWWRIKYFMTHDNTFEPLHREMTGRPTARNFPRRPGSIYIWLGARDYFTQPEIDVHVNCSLF